MGNFAIQYGIVPVTLALALLIKFFFVFHGLKTFFFYSLKLNFICYLNRFFTFDYSLWDGGRHTFWQAKTNFNLQTLLPTAPSYEVYISQTRLRCSNHRYKNDMVNIANWLITTKYPFFNWQ